MFTVNNSAMDGDSTEEMYLWGWGTDVIGSLLLVCRFCL